MARRTLTLFACALSVVACKGSEPAPAEAPDPRTADAAPAAPAEPPTPHPVADPGSQRALRTGERPATTLAPQPLTATRRHEASGHTWLSCPMPSGAESATATELQPVRIRLRGGAHGYAVRVPGPTPARDELVVRLVGAPPPGPIELLVERDPATRWGDPFAPWVLQRVDLSVPAGLPDDRALPAAFFRGLARDLGAWGTRPGSATPPFFAFASARAQRLAGDTSPDAAARPTRAPKTELAETMSLYTGLTSVAEALQTDRGLMTWGSGRTTTGPPVPLASIEGVPMAQHPWDAMLAATGKAPVIEPLASYIPQDVLYIHMGDLRTAVRLAADADDWLESLLQAVEARPATSHLVARYERELMLERTGLAETLGPLAAHGIALVLGDPFVREGTDLSLVIEVRKRSLLMTALATYEAQARVRDPALTETRWSAGEHPVRLVSSADGSVRQHRLELGDLLILSNSRAAIERFAAVADGRSPPLSASGDFRWMRAVYPYDPAAEDAFLFMGDAFVARAVSPRTKILQGRRMAAQADLLAVGFAQLLHGMLEGAPAPTAEALVASGLLDARELRHPDGAPIVLEPTRGARSERWGRADALTPLADLTLTEVSAEERDAYARFRDTYQQYWRGYIDPIAVRLRRSADGKRLSLDARMMPLVSGTEYDELVDKVGTTSFPPPARVGGVRWTLGIAADAPLRRELDGVGRSMKLGGLSWLGDTVMLGAASRSGLWDAALQLEPDRWPQLPAEPDAQDGDRRKREMEAIAHLPVYVGARIANPLGLATTLTALRTLAETTAPGLAVWGAADPYREVPIVTVSPGPGAGDPELRDVRLYYATVGDAFYATLDLGTLQTLIDETLDRPTAPDGDSAEAPRQADLRVGLSPDAPWLARTAALLVERELRRASWRAWRDIEVLAAGLGALPAEGEPRRQAALGFFGYEPVAGPGASFSVDAEGRLTHSLYGTEASPRFPALPVPGSPLARLADELDQASFGLAFEGEDESRGLRALVTWQRR